MEAIDAGIPNDEWLVALIGLRGFPLGEHRRIGGVDDRMYGEQVQVPWLLRFPDGIGRLGRSSALVTQGDLMPTFLDYLRIDRPQAPDFPDGISVLPLTANPRANWRNTVLTAGHGSWAIRTPEWCLRQDGAPGAIGSEEFASELYVRPDDRWEANDVAKLCPEVVESLTQEANAFSQHLAQTGRAP
jgi:arylsulfatase A-like enzyme